MISLIRRQRLELDSTPPTNCNRQHLHILIGVSRVGNKRERKNPSHQHSYPRSLTTRRGIWIVLITTATLWDRNWQSHWTRLNSQDQEPMRWARNWQQEIMEDTWVGNCKTNQRKTLWTISTNTLPSHQQWAERGLNSVSLRAVAQAKRTVAVQPTPRSSIKRWI